MSRACLSIVEDLDASYRSGVRSRSVGRSHAESFVTRSTYSGQRPTPQALPATPSLSLFLSLVRPTISLAPLITLPFYNAPLCSATAEPCIFLDAMDFPKAFRCSASLAPFPTCLCQSLRDKPKAELSFYRNNTSYEKVSLIVDRNFSINYQFLG